MRRVSPSHCRHEGLSRFLEAGKGRLAGDTARATTDEVKELWREASALKEVSPT
jgi:hypothetical protein